MPLALAVRAVMLHFGAYLMVSPKARIAPVSAWGHNWALAWHSVRLLFGGRCLGARALVPAGIQGRLTAVAATAVPIVAALLPMSLVAAEPPAVPQWAQLTAWLTHATTRPLSSWASTRTT